MAKCIQPTAHIYLNKLLIEYMFQKKFVKSTAHNYFASYESKHPSIFIRRMKGGKYWEYHPKFHETWSSKYWLQIPSETNGNQIQID